MSRFVFSLTLIVFIFFAPLCFADNYDNALAEIKAEKSVIAASWGPFKASSLYVAVKDDGSRRDGFAQYLCLILQPHGISGVVIHIMTLADYKEYNTSKDLGRHVCR